MKNVDMDNLSITSLHNFHRVMNSEKINIKHISYKDIRDNWNLYLEKQKNNSKKQLLNFYTHVPFCKQRCFGCTYVSSALKSQSELEYFLKYMDDYVNYFKDVLTQLPFINSYFGGGTPSILNIKQLKQLFTIIHNVASFDKFGQKTFECNPDSMDEDKVKLIKQFGFNRISFGVQSFSSNVLLHHKREYQNYQNIKNLIENSYKHGIINVNADLLFGLNNQSLSDSINDLDTLMKLNVKNITLYRMNHPTKNNKQELKIDQFAKSLIKLAKLLSKKRNYHMQDANYKSHAFIFNNNNNIKSNKNINIPKEYGQIVTYSDISDYPFSLFGIGPRIRCNIFAQLRYTYASYKNKNKEYMKQYYKFNPNTIIASSHKVDLKYEILTLFANSLSNSHIIDLNKYQKWYPIELNSYFKVLFDKLKSEKLINFDNNIITMCDEEFETRWNFLRRIIQFETK